MITDGASFADWALAIAANIFIVILVWRSLGYYAKEEWGKMAGHIAASVVIAGFVYFPDQTIALLQFIWGRITGQG